MKRLIMLLLLLLPLPGFAEVVMENAWIREAPPNSRVLAAYMTLSNKGDKTMTVTAVSSPDFERVEIHNMTMKDGMMKMFRLDELPVKAGSSVALKPGGMHMMLIKPLKKLKAGATVRLDLSFADGTRMELAVPVKKAQ